VDDIRTLVDQVRFAPQAGKYKVYIIDEVHMLSSSAFNAFLKTLEEPPPYAVFILATTEKHKILPTILSRCQIFDFKRITSNDTVHHLKEICEKEDIKADKTSLQLIAQKSEGCMRDALSILDKIVSFTNGEVKYQNTLEHLNILDEDYYFKLIECMQQQDLAEAMLLYDDINRKGFEGDMVLNGFAEFIRNLLVCKDEKCAALLEAVEGFREKYITTAKNISAGYLVSALNVLNEAEINYKAARNKRLHVELALIKLCYLHQAIELASDTDSSRTGIGKKKLVDAAKPVAFRNIEPIEISLKPSKNESKEKLIIDGEQNGKLAVEEGSQSNKSDSDSHRDRISKSESATTKLAALDKIRKQVRGSTDNGTGVIAKPIQQEELQMAWNEYAAKLKQEKNPAGQNFEMAELRLQDDNSFIALVNNNIQLRFIEQQGLKVSQFLREKLQNHLLQFYIVMQENIEPTSAIEAPLTAREQFQKMVEQYPLVKDLKDRLRLELDY
jgi:DNA polymerase-3 subunit gamma/tau